MDADPNYHFDIEFFYSNFTALFLIFDGMLGCVQVLHADPPGQAAAVPLGGHHQPRCLHHAQLPRQAGQCRHQQQSAGPAEI